LKCDPLRCFSCVFFSPSHTCFILFGNYSPSPHSHGCLLALPLSLSSIIPGGTLGPISPQALPTDCITTCRSFITYISAFPPLPIVWLMFFFVVPFPNRSFLSLSLCTSCVGLLSLDMCIHYRGLGLDWTGHSPIVLVMVLLVVSCYKTLAPAEVIAYFAPPLFLHGIYIIYSYVRRAVAPFLFFFRFLVSVVVE
jgi:hypothetical protein